MADAAPKIRLNGLARRLVRDKLLAPDIAQKANDNAHQKDISFVTHLVKEKLVPSLKIAVAGSEEFGIPLFDLSILDTENAPFKLVDEKLIRKHHSLPIFQRGQRLFLAVSDPTNLIGMDEIKFHTGLSTEIVVVEEDKLIPMIDKAIASQDTSMRDLVGGDDNLDIEISDGDDQGDTGGGDSDLDETPVVRFINKILLDAINIGASDLHFEPYEKSFRIRFRVDGILKEVSSPPSNLRLRMIARIKVMSKMNLAEKRVPQDGRIKMVLSKTRSIDFRVNTCPTLYGEKIVLRILDPNSATLGIDALGFEPEQREAFETALNKPYGLVLVTGPTGSGKTVTLYTALNILNTEKINISTAEDPVEIQVTGINQVNVNNMVGLTFSVALKAFLRQDPDIIMVGEIRDIETGEIAVKAAQTGHLVFSTLHTNDAPQTLTRLANMGIAPFNIASSVLLIMAQRLARRLCEICKTPVTIPKEALLEEGFKEDEIDSLKLFKAVGCDRCNEGFKGRVGIFQIMPVSDAMGRIIMEEGNSIQLGDQAAAEGIWDLRQSGLHKVKSGLISLEELNRITTE